MAMSKKHYEKIAEAFREEHSSANLCENPDTARLQLAYLAQRLCPIFKADNPAFDAERFYNACFPD